MGRERGRSRLGVRPDERLPLWRDHLSSDTLSRIQPHRLDSKSHRPPRDHTVVPREERGERERTREKPNWGIYIKTVTMYTVGPDSTGDHERLRRIVGNSSGGDCAEALD